MDDGINFSILRDRRDEFDLSNAKLAELVEISEGYLANILCGKDKPSNRIIHRFARVLDLPFEEIKGSTPTEEPQPPKPSKDPSAPPSRKTTKKAPKRVRAKEAAA